MFQSARTNRFAFAVISSLLVAAGPIGCASATDDTSSSEGAVSSPRGAEQGFDRIVEVSFDQVGKAITLTAGQILVVDAPKDKNVKISVTPGADGSLPEVGEPTFNALTNSYKWQTTEASVGLIHVDFWAKGDPYPIGAKSVQITIKSAKPVQAATAN